MLDQRATTFLRVCEAGSFSKSAKSLFVSSVWVMKQINSLESSLGVSLFNRTNQGVTPTEAGRALFEELSRLERDGEKAVARVRAIVQDSRAAIRIGTSVLRPCRPLIDLLSCAASAASSFRIEVVPFEDGPKGLSRTVASLGQEVDCFVSPCDSRTWRETCNILELGTLQCAVAMPRNNPLASRPTLRWKDLDGQSLMLIRRGESPVLDRLREDIEENHPHIDIIDMPTLYGTDAFNECVQQDCLMESFDMWADVHPAIITLPVEWDYELPYGIVYAADPEPHLQAFIDMVSSVKAEQGRNVNAPCRLSRKA